MVMPSVVEEIKRRSKLDSSLAELNAACVERYGLELVMGNFAPGLFRMTDLSGRTVSIVHSEIREGKVHSSSPMTDVIVFATGSPCVIIGWTPKDNLVDIQDRFLSNVKSLYPMPNVFDFGVPCPHLEVYGGIYNEQDSAWECAGCGKQIVTH
jgi:hypothetical protein